MVKKEGSKVYIEGVRKLSWDTGEMCEFASALVSALGSLGDSIAYDYVMGTSGAAFRFTIDPGAWEFGNYGIRNFSPDPQEPVCRAIEAEGYDYTLCDKTTYQEDLQKITHSIDQGIPVLAYGVVGPSDCCILCGYDQEGEVLLGWSTYQDIPDDHNIPHDVTGYFRKPGWYEKLGGYVLIGNKSRQPTKMQVYLDAFSWALRLIRTPRLEQKHTGLEGLRTWAEEMNDAKYFPEGDAETMGIRYVSTAINYTMLRDHGAALPFLTRAAEELPVFMPEISLAAACYAEVNRLTRRMGELISDNFSETAMRAICDAEIRRAYAAVLLEIRDQEQIAASHLERLLKRCG